MTWEIVTGLIALVSACIAIGKVISNNTKALTEVKVSVDQVKEVLGEQKSELKILSQQVNEIDRRVIKLEEK